MKIDKKFYEDDIRANDFEPILETEHLQLIDMIYKIIKGKERRPDYRSYRERLNRSRAPEIETEK